MTGFKKEYIPNYLSIFRIALVPVFFWLTFVNLKWAAVVFVISAASDVVDGMIARKNGWVTDMGKVLDPLADKTMQVGILLALWLNDIIPTWLLVIIAVKEITMVIGATVILGKEKKYVKANWYGKLATVVFYCAIGIIMMNHILFEVPNPTFEFTLQMLIVATMLLSFCMYAGGVYKIVIKKQNPKKERNNIY